LPFGYTIDQYRWALFDGSGANFINVLQARFSYQIFGSKSSNPKASFIVFGGKILYKKCARKKLMKLTTGDREKLNYLWWTLR